MHNQCFSAESGQDIVNKLSAVLSDIWELDNGDFAVIGIDITDFAASKLPLTAGCGPDERIVRLPRNLLVNAKRDIPDRP